MKARVDWHQLAEEDLATAHAHIGGDSPAAAERLLDAVERAISVLLARPRAGRPRQFRSPRASGIRSWVVAGFENYLVFYRPQPWGIEVVRFLHGARDLPSLVEDES